VVPPLSLSIREREAFSLQSPDIREPVFFPLGRKARGSLRIIRQICFPELSFFFSYVSLSFLPFAEDTSPPLLEDQRFLVACGLLLSQNPTRAFFFLSHTSKRKFSSADLFFLLYRMDLSPVVLFTSRVFFFLSECFFPLSLCDDCHEHPSFCSSSLGRGSTSLYSDENRNGRHSSFLEREVLFFSPPPFWEGQSEVSFSIRLSTKPVFFFLHFHADV